MERIGVDLDLVAHEGWRHATALPQTPKEFDLLAFLEERRCQVATREEDTGGAGSGPAIAKGLAEAHAGAISPSDTESGCEFMVHLPAESPR